MKLLSCIQQTLISIGMCVALLLPVAPALSQTQANSTLTEEWLNKGDDLYQSDTASIQAVILWKQASDAGSGEASYRLAMLYNKKSQVSSPSVDDHPDPDNIRVLIRYFSGPTSFDFRASDVPKLDVTNPNFALMMQYLRLAAEREIPMAMCDLAQFYFAGLGVPKDEEAAVTLLQNSALLGEYAAKGNILHRYEVGDGVPKDINQTIYWLKKSNDSYENTDAKLHLAQIYCLGQGVPRDLAQCKGYLNQIYQAEQYMPYTTKHLLAQEGLEKYWYLVDKKRSR